MYDSGGGGGSIGTSGTIENVGDQERRCCYY
jgi:hypothetical protein